MNHLTRQQFDILMSPLRSNRVAKRKVQGRDLSYLEAWDVRAHLIRIFGFGGFSVTADQAELVSHLTEQGQSKRNHVVSWKVRVTLEVPVLGATYSEYAIGTANLPDVGEAMDMAIKTAESDGLKRAAINLGTQFGLSLYNNGQYADVIQKCLVEPGPGDAAPEMPDVPVVVEEAVAEEVVVDTETGEMTPAEVAETLGGEVVDAGQILSEAREAWLVELRAAAVETDNSKRILAIAGLKQKASGTDILSSTVPYKGSDITLARLADLAAQGDFVKAAS
ncbi:MAG: Rad52/Rad22 family DNA repair protein [Azonexus sp.]